MNEQQRRIPARGTVVGEGPTGRARARIVQGSHAQVGPVHIGVLAARHRRSDGQGEVFARMLLGDGENSDTVEVAAGDEIDLGEAGTLHIVQIAPQDPRHSGPGMPGAARGAVFVELVPG